MTQTLHIQGLERKLNFSLPLGQGSLKFFSGQVCYFNDLVGRQLA